MCLSKSILHFQKNLIVLKQKQNEFARESNI